MDIQNAEITRFFAGFLGSAPVTNTGGLLGDTWAMTQQETATVRYAFVFIGYPASGHILGVAVVQSYIRRR